MDTQLQNRVVLVTGGSGGIGREIVKGFIGEGARVVLHYNEHANEAEQIAHELGNACVPLRADLTLEAEVEVLFEEIEAGMGPVEIVVANAGIWPAESTPIHEMTLEQWQTTIDVNLTSVFLCMRQFFRGIVEHGVEDPAAVLIGSTAGIFGEAGHADYAASKSALVYGLARTLKNEICRIAPRGRVNVVAPGWTRTKMTEQQTSDPEQVRKVLRTVPLRKIARVSDIAKAVIYLASSHLSGHVTGQTLTVSGGMEGRVLYYDDEIDPERA